MRRTTWDVTRYGEVILRERDAAPREAEIDRISREHGAESVVLVARGRDGRWHSTAVARTSRRRNARRIAA